MTYTNPVIPGFHPDPSVVRVDQTYYLVTSSFNYFPGVPLFESQDLVNWQQIGHVLTRTSQLPLADANTHSGIYAPTLRYHAGRFYMVTTNTSTNQNFYVTTADIHGSWSDPIPVVQGGIDPSLYFENGKAYFMSNGEDDTGKSGIAQCEIDLATGKKLTPSTCIWTGAGGRYLEGPHLYKIGGWYYLLASEGGTEYGHMLVYARSRSLFGPFTNYSANPVLTNRNLGGYQLQGVGHGDLVDDGQGHWYLVHLAFRQLDRWLQHHTLGREVCLTPVKFDDQGWFTAGVKGTCRLEMTVPALAQVKQQPLVQKTFATMTLGGDWVFLRNPQMANYRFDRQVLALKPNTLPLEATTGSPTAVFTRQLAFVSKVHVALKHVANLVGISAYMESNQHFDAVVWPENGRLHAARRLRIGPAFTLDHEVVLPAGQVGLTLVTTAHHDHFYVTVGQKQFDLGAASAQYLSSEISGNFTGVMLSLFTEAADQEPEWNELTDFSYQFKTGDTQ